VGEQQGVQGGRTTVCWTQSISGEVQVARETAEATRAAACLLASWLGLCEKHGVQHSAQHHNWQKQRHCLQGMFFVKQERASLFACSTGLRAWCIDRLHPCLLVIPWSLVEDSPLAGMSQHILLQG